MAQVSSGSFTTNEIEGRSLKFNWSVDSTSISENYKKIYWSLIGSGSAGGYVMAGNFKVVIDGQTVYNSETRIQLWNGTVVKSGYVTLYHNNEGNKSFSASVQAGIYDVAVNSTGSGTWELPTISRYLKITNFSISNITETSAIVSWSTSDKRDSTYYSFDNGATWIGSSTYGESISSDNKSGAFNLQELNANTTYNIKIKIKRADSQLWTESENISFSTYNYPYCTDSPNFTIGNAMTLKLYNPLGRAVKIRGIAKNNNSEIFSADNFTGISVTGFNDSNSVNRQYASVPNTRNGAYKVEVIYGNVTMTRDNGNTYSIRGNETPTINAFDYVDSNGNTVAITGNNKYIVQNKSILQAQFHPATANYGASGISKYIIEVNGLKREETREGAYDLGTINSNNDVDLTLTVVDSRGLSASKAIKVSMLSYSAPTFTTYLERLNNYEDETYLKVDGSVSSVNGGNKIEVLQYRYKVSGGSYGNYNSIEDNKQYTLSLNKENAFIFEIIIKDTMGTVTVDTVPLGKGVFPLFIDTVLNSVGINCLPTVSNALEVMGRFLFNQKEIIIGKKGVLKGGETFTHSIINHFGGFIVLRVWTNNTEYFRIYAVGGANKWAFTTQELLNHTLEGDANARATFSFEGDASGSHFHFKVNNTGSVDLEYSINMINFL